MFKLARKQQRNLLQICFFSNRNNSFDEMGMIEKITLASNIKRKTDELNVQLTKSEVQVVDSTGLAQAIVNGLGAPLRIIVSPELAQKSANEISLAVTQATIKAHLTASKEMQEKIAKIYSEGGLPFPSNN